MKKVLQNKKGETIVEVVVAFVLLLMFTAVFTLALRFAQRTAVRAESEREAAYQATTALYPTEDGSDAWSSVTTDDTKEYKFTYAFTNKTITVSDVKKCSLDAKDTDGNVIYTFHAYKKGTS